MPCRLAGLQPQHYEHPHDKLALDTVQGTPGLEFVTKKFWELGLERSFRIQFTGSNLRVSPEFLPSVHEMVAEACRILNIAQMPDVYVMRGHAINAFTTGVTRPLIVLHSGAIDLLEDAELQFIIGHELGHIKSNHMLYHQIAQVLPVLGDIVGAATLNIGGLVSTGLQIALLNWQRMSEFTADRAGLLACQDPDVAIRTMVKLAGLPKRHYKDDVVGPFLKQAAEFEGLDSALTTRAAKFFSIMWQDHPWTVMRAAEFQRWVASGQYGAILQYFGAGLPAQVLCDSCSSPLVEKSRFCSHCGTERQVA